MFRHARKCGLIKKIRKASRNDKRLPVKNKHQSKKFLFCIGVVLWDHGVHFS